MPAMTNASSLPFLSISEAAPLIAKRELSPVELTEACIARSQVLDTTLNAYITPTFDAALVEAKQAADEIAAGKYRGPLHGIPLALKDLFETAGVRTTAASPFREDEVPQQDAEVVSRLKQAGAVSLGKLNMHEWALGTTNVNTYFPTARNPWNPAHITGGSSGGSGAAVAAGMCLGSLGSDTGGSIRIPASFCGISGLKPTYGRVSLRGAIPLAWSLDHAGPMARSAADCALLLQAIAGFDAEDPTSADVPCPDFAAFLETSATGLRIGLPRNFFFDKDALSPEVDTAVRAAASLFERLGAAVSEVDVPDVVLPDIFATLLAETAAYHADRLREAPEKFASSVYGRMAPALDVTGMQYSEARYRQLEAKQALRSIFESVDLLLTPTTVLTAPAIPTDGSEIPPASLSRNTRAFNITGAPSISIPCGFSTDGLPIGMQLTGAWWAEGTVLRAAHAYQQATDWHKRRPPV
jgi:aspartyl-tRNA(Asn)/glutamyl-tRNA(Gln) amidotransferase subunit A